MSVYIEAVILDNFLITFLTATASYRFMSLQNGRLRKVIAALFGTVVAVFYPFMSFNAWILLAIKLVLTLSLSFILFFRRCNILKGAGAFLLLTFFFGGALFCFSLILCGDPMRALTEPITPLPPSVVIGAIFFLYLISKRVIIKVKKLDDMQRFMFDVEVRLLGKSAKIKGFLDSGNRLYDVKSGLPVIILSARACIDLLDGENLRLAIEKKGENIMPEAHYIEYSTLNEKISRMLVLKPEAIILYSDKCEHTIKDIMVGLSFFGFNDSLNYDAILHPAIIKKFRGDLC